jgi:hypothetical protein
LEELWDFCHCESHSLSPIVFVWRIERSEAVSGWRQRERECALLRSCSLLVNFLIPFTVLHLCNTVFTIPRHDAFQAPALQRGRWKHVLYTNWAKKTVLRIETKSIGSGSEYTFRKPALCLYNKTCMKYIS